MHSLVRDLEFVILLLFSYIGSSLRQTFAWCPPNCISYLASANPLPLSSLGSYVIRKSLPRLTSFITITRFENHSEVRVACVTHFYFLFLYFVAKGTKQRMSSLMHVLKLMHVLSERDLVLFQMCFFSFIQDAPET